VRQALEWIPTRWYAVFPGGQVLNCPKRKRTQVLRLCGIDQPWRVARSAALGFEHLTPLQASVLLFSAEPQTSTQLLNSVNQLRGMANWKLTSRSTLYSTVSSLKQLGLVDSVEGYYQRTELAELERGRKSPVLAVIGERLRDDSMFAGCKRLDEINGVCVLCGCTEHDACWDDLLGACNWVAPGLCSHCDRSES